VQHRRRTQRRPLHRPKAIRSAARAAPDTVARISHFTKDGNSYAPSANSAQGPPSSRPRHDIAMDAEGGSSLPTAATTASDPRAGRPLRRRVETVRPPERRYTCATASSTSRLRINGVAPNPAGSEASASASSRPQGPLNRIPDPQEMKGTSAAEGVAGGRDGPSLRRRKSGRGSFSSISGADDRLPHPRRARRHVEVPDAVRRERVDDGVHHEVIAPAQPASPQPSPRAGWSSPAPGWLSQPIAAGVSLARGVGVCP